MKIFGINLIPHASSNKEILSKLDAIKKEVQSFDMIIPSTYEAALPMSYNESTAIPFDDYRVIGYLIKCRSIKNKDDIFYKEEELERKAMEFLSDKDFENFDVVFAIFEANSSMSPHYHTFKEIMTLVSGAAKCTMNGGENMSVKTPVVIEPYKVHKFEGIEPGIVIVKKPKK
jgi:quercetin dioxygenase-like cupin family protein